MSYRGQGGYRGDLTSSVYSLGDEGNESEGLDFSDVTGGSSTVYDPGYSFDLGNVLTGGLSSLGGLGGIGSAISKFVGGGGGGALALGSAAAAGASAMSSPTVKNTVKKALKRALGMRGGSGRRMNPGNFRALHRSMRRLSAFERAAKRVYKFTHPARGHSKFKFPRRKKR